MTTARPAFLLAALVLSACAATPADAPQASGGPAQCFRASQVNGFTPVDRDTVRVNIGAQRVYELELFSSCPDVDWAQRIGIRSTSGSDLICTGLAAELIVPRTGLPTDRCQVSALRRVSAEELAAERAG